MTNKTYIYEGENLCRIVDNSQTTLKKSKQQSLTYTQINLNYINIFDVGNQWYIIVMSSQKEGSEKERGRKRYRGRVCLCICPSICASKCYLYIHTCNLHTLCADAGGHDKAPRQRLLTPPQWLPTAAGAGALLQLPSSFIWCSSLHAMATKAFTSICVPHHMTISLTNTWSNWICMHSNATSTYWLWQIVMYTYIHACQHSCVRMHAMTRDHQSQFVIICYSWCMATHNAHPPDWNQNVH